MAKIDPVALHPLEGPPYDKLHFVRMTATRVPLYWVEGTALAPAGALASLQQAFRKYGGSCFYCGRQFPAQDFSKAGAHRDHVVARSHGGSDRLHNLVIACSKCGTAKADRAVQDFQPTAAKTYLAALERHLARALGAGD